MIFQAILTSYSGSSRHKMKNLSLSFKPSFLYKPKFFFFYLRYSNIVYTVHGSHSLKYYEKIKYHYQQNQSAYPHSTTLCRNIVFKNAPYQSIATLSQFGLRKLTLDNRVSGSQYPNDQNSSCGAPTMTDLNSIQLSCRLPNQPNQSNRIFCTSPKKN